MQLSSPLSCILSGLIAAFFVIQSVLNNKILQCLGDWSGPSGQRYLGLLHQPPAASAGPHSSSPSPRYRCAVRFSGESKIGKIDPYTVCFSMLQMYKKEEGTGRIKLTMSKDSTCHLLAEERSTP